MKNKVRHFSYIGCLWLFLACNSNKKESVAVSIDVLNVEKVEVYELNSKNKLKMKKGFETMFIKDFNEAVTTEPRKFKKTYRVLIHYKIGSNDTILSNGENHQYKRWSKTAFNLIEKYKEN
ncbi:protein of unknown function [Tenacibaculum sp. 190130A14a]|uniref:Lipoprotein n=1 Tax=Tenacibaculum polynesiense TaxID=3137857 RepID=A0ABP1F0A7_9FLAO